MKWLLSISVLLLWSVPAFSADHVPSVFLGHFSIALDQSTYEALRSSPEIAALAAVEERHTITGDESWTGFYVYGRQTYMEFFAADRLPADTLVGDCALALDVEEPGGIVAIAAHLGKTFGNSVKIHTTAATIATGSIPWFTSTYIDQGLHYALATWFMGLDPGYLAAMHPESRIDHPLSRAQNLSGDFRADRPLDNVTAVTAALSSEESSALATELALVGWTIRRGDRGFVAIGPGGKIRVVPASARVGIQAVEFRLRQTVPKQTISLGNAELRLFGNNGQLVFWQ